MLRDFLPEGRLSSLVILLGVVAAGCAGEASSGAPSPTDSAAALSGECAGSPQWADGVHYPIDAVVQYSGKVYRCTLAHTSLSSWTPDAAPALWQEAESCAGTPNPPSIPNTGPGPDPEPDPGQSPGGARFSGYTSYNIYSNVSATNVKCELDPNAYGLMVTAIRHDIFSDYAEKHGGRLAICDKCVSVTSEPRGGGNGGTVVVRIIDESNDFSSNGGNRLLDMAPEAFEKIGDKDAGSIPVDFQIVDCPAGLQ